MLINAAIAVIGSATPKSDQIPPVKIMRGLAKLQKSAIINRMEPKLMLVEGQHVRIKHTHHCFGGVTGKIGDSPVAFSGEQIAEPYTVYWVDFDEEKDDGKDDGPYCGASIGWEHLEPVK